MIAIPHPTSERAVAHRSSQTHPPLARVRRSLPAPRRLFTLFSATMLLIVPFFSPAALSAKQTAEPVTVEGAVAVVNDSLNTPFLKAFSTNIDATHSSGEIAFDIPDGKRLVIEAINVSVFALHGQTFEGMFVLSTDHSMVLGSFPLQRTGLVRSATNREHQVAFPPLKARVDAQPGVTGEVRVIVERDDATDTAGLTVTVMGYLVDL